MRQSMEAEPMTQPGHNDNDVSLAQILTEVVEEVRLSIDRDINGADLLYSLLSAPWLYSLLRVYECLVQYTRDGPSPQLPNSSRLSQEIIASVQRLAVPSSEAQELDVLLRNPHMQALLSVHDSVALRDYGPVLPPLPDELPVDEEVMRIVCLVKNKQPLCIGDEKPGHWNSLRRLTVEKLALDRRLGSGQQNLLESAGGLSSSTGLLCCTPPAQSCSLPRYQSTSCKLCFQTALLPGGGLNQSAPAVCGSVTMDGVETNTEDQQHKNSPKLYSSLASPHTCCPPGCGFHSQTAPSSPLLQRHHSPTRSTYPSLVSTKRQSLDELKSTMHTVASSMEKNTTDVRDLRQEMVAVTEMMTDSVEENAQALSLLVEVVDKLQGLIIARRSPHVAWAPRPQNVSSHPKVPAQKSYSNASIAHPPALSTSSSSTSSSCSSTSLRSYMDVPHATPNSLCRSSSQNGRTSLSNGLLVSRLKNEDHTTLCLSSKKKKSKMRK